MSRLKMAAAATIAAAVLIPQTPAQAQPAGITVTAPRARDAWDPKFTVHHPMQLRASVWVPTADLDLRTYYGRHALDYRMRVAAYEACRQLRLIEPSPGVGGAMNPDPQDCRQRAYHNARRQAGYVIYAAG
jgi:UrcA family protein